MSEKVISETPPEEKPAEVEAQATEREHNSRKVKLRRIVKPVQKLDEQKQPVMIDEPVIMLTQASIPVPDKPYKQIALDPKQIEFEFPAEEAAYLLREHPDALEPVPDSPTRLKTITKE